MAEQKYQKLLAFLQQQGKVAVAFSGGIDSTLLLYAAIEALGTVDVLPLHITSVLNSAQNLVRTRTIYRENFPRSITLTEIEVFPLVWPDFVINNEKRCYFCKNNMYRTLLATMKEKGFQKLADGTNADDLLEDRPGLLAVRELGVLTPLVEAGLTKREIRWLGRKKNLTNFSMPSNSCLATRVSGSRQIDNNILRVIDNAEQYLAGLGFDGCRVRVGGDYTIIEVQTKDIEKITESTHRKLIQNYLQSLGLNTIMLSLQGR